MLFMKHRIYLLEELISTTTKIIVTLSYFRKLKLNEDIKL